MICFEELDRVVWRLPVVAPTPPLWWMSLSLDVADGPARAEGMNLVATALAMAVMATVLLVAATGLFLVAHPWLGAAILGLVGVVGGLALLRWATRPTLVCVVELTPTALRLSVDAPGVVGDTVGAVAHGVPIAVADGIAFDWAELTHAHLHPGPTLELRTADAEYSIPIHGASGHLAELQRLQKQLDAHRRGRRGRAPADLETLRR